MLLNDDQIQLLCGDLDYILARTKCDTMPLGRAFVQNAILRDPDVLLDLVDALPLSDARWLSVPFDVLSPMIQRRHLGLSGRSGGDQILLPGV